MANREIRLSNDPLATERASLGPQSSGSSIDIHKLLQASRITSDGSGRTSLGLNSMQTELFGLRVEERAAAALISNREVRPKN